MIVPAFLFNHLLINSFESSVQVIYLYGEFKRPVYT